MDIRSESNVSREERVQMLRGGTSSEPGGRDNTFFIYDEINQGNNGLPLNQRNNFTGANENEVSRRWDSMKRPCILFLMFFSFCVNVGLIVLIVILALWFNRPDAVVTITPAVPVSSSMRYRHDLFDYKNLVAMPCDNELHRFYPNMKTEKINTTISKEPNPDFCYLPNSERSYYLLKIFALASARKTNGFGVEERHCISLNGRVNDINNKTIIEWSEVPRDPKIPQKGKSIYKVVRDVRTSELELSGPSGHYLVMASTIYRNPDLSSLWMSIPAKLEVLTTSNQRVLLSQTKSLWPSDFGFTSLSVHDVVYINDGENIVFRMGNEQYLWRLKQGGHNAHLCCLPALGGCGS